VGAGFGMVIMSGLGTDVLGADVLALAEEVIASFTN
jgi:hypothetical protein